MEGQEEPKERIRALREKYTRLCWNCKMHGARVNGQTVEEYRKKIEQLQNQLG
jgi:hypothetical protein